MFGSKNSGRLRWYLAALGFVWAAAFAGIAGAGGNKVTICHFPPGNPANYQQITIAAAGVAAHLAHGDFLGTCASDCTVTPTLCSTPPDQCHQAGTCNASTGLCQFPPQSDGTACNGPDGRVAILVKMARVLPFLVVRILMFPVQWTSAHPQTAALASRNTVRLPYPGPLTIVNGNPPVECYVIQIESTLGECIETCLATVCGDGSDTVCGQARHV